MQSEDICEWPDGTWCYGYELEEMLTFMSDDYQVHEMDSDRWTALTIESGI